MAPKRHYHHTSRPLTRRELAAILKAAADGMTRRNIAKRHRITQDRLLRILRGQQYSDITGIDPVPYDPARAPCPRCGQTRARSGASRWRCYPCEKELYGSTSTPSRAAACVPIAHNTTAAILYTEDLERIPQISDDAARILQFPHRYAPADRAAAIAEWHAVQAAIVQARIDKSAGYRGEDFPGEFAP